MFAIPSPRTSRRRTLSELSLAGFSAPPVSPLAALPLDRNTPRLQPLRFVKRDVPKRSKTLDVHPQRTSRKPGITDENASPRGTRPARASHARKRSDGITPQDVFDFRRARASLKDVLPRTLAALPEDPFISEGKVVRCAGRDARDRRVCDSPTSVDLPASGIGYSPSSSSRIGRPGASKDALQFSTSDSVARAASSIALRWTPLTDPHSALFRGKWAEWYACSHAPEPETHFRTRFAPGFRRMCASVDDAIAKIRHHSIGPSNSNSIISQSHSISTSNKPSNSYSNPNSKSQSQSNSGANSADSRSQSRSLSGDDAVRLALLREMREELELQRVACLVDPHTCGPEDVAEVMARWREGFCVCEERACEERHY